MQTRSRTRSAVIPRPPQSVAALLPPEIVDCIFSHFDFDYSLDALTVNQKERNKNLGNMSVVAEGWKGPARRLLCRTVRIVRTDRLAEGVPEWARGGLRNVKMTSGCWASSQSQEAAGATFRFLTNAPNLRLLHLSNLPFHSFSSNESNSLRTTLFLPLLRDLTVSNRGLFPHSVISDILATSNHQISRLRLWNSPVAVPPISDERLDFGGNLRYLRVEGNSSLLNYFQLLPDGLVGLREVYVEKIDRQSSDRTQELLTEVAPSLEKLTIGNGDVTGIVEPFPLLTRLTRLSLPSVPALLDSLPLPPSLVSLQFVNDDDLLPLFNRWTATPALLPDTLQRVIVRFIRDHRTLERLPPVAEFGTVYAKRLEDMLWQLSPLTLPLTTLSVYFYDRWSVDIAVVEAECKRLGVKFCRNLDMWTH